MDFCTGDIAKSSLITSKQHSKALQDERGKRLPLNHCQVANHCS